MVKDYKEIIWGLYITAVWWYNGHKERYKNGIWIDDPVLDIASGFHDYLDALERLGFDVPTYLNLDFQIPLENIKEMREQYELNWGSMLEAFVSD